MTGYKLTRQDMTTYGGCKWVVGEEKAAPGAGPLCTPGWLHFYRSPLIADFMNPIHANYSSPRLWEVEVGGIWIDDGDLKSGASELTLLREIPYTQMTTEERVTAAIIIALESCHITEWRQWAQEWLDDKDRSATAAWAARAAWEAKAATAAWAAKAATAAWEAKAAWAAKAAAATAAAKAAVEAKAACDRATIPLELTLSLVVNGFYPSGGTP